MSRDGFSSGIGNDIFEENYARIFNKDKKKDVKRIERIQFGCPYCHTVSMEYDDAEECRDFCYEMIKIVKEKE